MLVLARMIDERIFIGPDIILTVVSIGGGQVRIGVDAPKSVRVDREEVRKAVDREARAAERERQASR
jgi:carbon storage regulator